MLRKCRVRTILTLLVISVVAGLQVGCDDPPEVGLGASGSVTCSSGQKCGSEWEIHGVIQFSAPAQFASATSQSSIAAYTLIWNVPSSDFTLNTQSPVQAMLTATTDTNYTSSITVTMSPAKSTTAPVAAGYSVYTFSLENSTALSNWVSQVSSNTRSSATFSFSSSALFNLLANAGTYTVYLQVNSSQAGVTEAGSGTVTDPGANPPPTRCTGNNCQNQP
jgi:hypothetical protein